MMTDIGRIDVSRRPRRDQSVTATEGDFRIDGQTEHLYGAAVHYWRLDRDKWDGILQSVKDLGFTMISIYIPWEAHEIERGMFDFGKRDPRTDIDAFLTLCEEKGFRIVVRPGPQINSELTWFGYPKRILADPELHALSAQGSKAILTQVPKPIPALSYASDKFFEETALWYDAICNIIARHAHPNGGVVAAQVDNEMAFFFGINAYSGDFSPASLARYRDFLIGKYGSLKALNDAHGTMYATVDEVDPPRRFAATDKTHIPAYVDWVEYRERYLVDSMDRLAGMMRERGLEGIALFHNYPHPLGPGGAASGFTTPFNLPLLEEKLELRRLRHLLPQAPVQPRQDGRFVRGGHQPLPLHSGVHCGGVAVVSAPRRVLRRGVRHQGCPDAGHQGLQPLHARRARPVAGLSDPA